MTLLRNKKMYIFISWDNNNHKPQALNKNNYNGLVGCHKIFLFKFPCTGRVIKENLIQLLIYFSLLKSNNLLQLMTLLAQSGK